MRRLSSLILFLVVSAALNAQTSPHGSGFQVTCSSCHSTSGWKVDLKNMTFNHGETKFPLTGRHVQASCRACHTSLEFAKAAKECIDCHTDVHNQTTGPRCERCHTPDSWLVTDITGLHARSRFPLIGAHVNADCFQCHVNASSSLLNFQPVGIACFDCHRLDYLSTTKPNHVAGNYSQNCTECHRIEAYSWTGAGINHSFFPLTGGHSTPACGDCHKSPDYSAISPVCASCHLDNYNGTTNPNHVTTGFPTDCKLCHTLAPGWKPAAFADHDGKYFPIYSGKHKGEWSVCSECHPNPASYAQFTCISCHEHNQGDMDGEHEGVQGYSYTSEACLACHPSGSGEGTFNHATSAFPLTGAHTTTTCGKCHTNGYAGTPSDCFACHAPDYTKTVNPAHEPLGLSTDCKTCHTTDPGWKPATFADHDGKYFPIYSGKHLGTWDLCSECHPNPTAYVQFTCISCHDHNQVATDNEHQGVQGYVYTSEACFACHPTGSGEGTFNHATSAFPLTGAHLSASCAQCHSSGYTGTPTDCFACHTPDFNKSANPSHVKLGIPTGCKDCHTTDPGWAPASFPIHGNYYILQGAHAAIAQNCSDCHKGNYNSTPNTCAGCHQANYNQTTNPPHAAAQFPLTCSDCHSQSAWTPANWDHDGQYFPIYSGKHKGEWNSCSDCHTNPANYSVFTCTTACHPQNSTNNEHQGVSGYSYNSAACYNCHPTGQGGTLFRLNERKE